VAAPLGVELVLDVAAGQAGVLELLHRAGHVHRLAEARVRVDEARQVREAGDLPAAHGHLGERGQPDVGQAQLVREHAAGDVHTGEALLLDQLR